eukprot:GHVR01066427.1.p1 GENE.GHVR01066427.1~~GHVR01066427.1.p1  ORF type:complete len:174 (+),score=31.45 GHVR01066427.1:365-886(+)
MRCQSLLYSNIEDPLTTNFQVNQEIVLRIGSLQRISSLALASSTHTHTHTHIQAHTGKYDTNTTLHIPSTRGQGGWTFGAICSSSSPRVGIHSDRPGPQTHSTYSELTTRRAPVCRFGSAVRHVSAPLMLKSSRTPGPGTYADQSEDSRKIAPSAPNYSMKSRRPLSFAKTFV